MIAEGDEIIGVICGPTKCGKTTLAISLSSWLWRRHRIRSIVFDPIRKLDWGRQCLVFSNLDKFKRAAWCSEHCGIFWDESSDSLNPSANDDKKFTTRIRHRHKAIYLMTHDFAVMNPMMRGNATDAYIFRQSIPRAKDWMNLFADEDLLQTSTLKKREFIHKIAMEPIRRRLPTLSELQNMKTSTP